MSPVWHKTLEDKILTAIFPNGSLIPVSELPAVQAFLIEAKRLEGAGVTPVYDDQAEEAA